MNHFSVRDACGLVGLPRVNWYRSNRPPTPAADRPRSARSAPPRALSAAEQQAILAVLHSPRFQDFPAREVYATLLDEGVYLCHWRTMYRLLEDRGETVERRRQRRHIPRPIPRLVARCPNAVWSWDITLLRGHKPREFFYLYVILDIYSRYVVGWLLAPVESDDLAEALIAQTCACQHVAPDDLTLHADRGSVMRSKRVSELLQKLGVDQSHSRPRVSNDNPYSESQFKSLKYHGSFPGQFESLEVARGFFSEWVAWYNHEHHHVGLALFTPGQVHLGEVGALSVVRQRALDHAYAAHPDRFVGGPPQVRLPPAEVWINRPDTRIEAASGLEATADERVR